MKDYNSIPFKNKAIDRLTRNTTIIPDTQIQEVTVTPTNQQASNYVTKANLENDRLKAETFGLRTATSEQSDYWGRPNAQTRPESHMKSDLNYFTKGMESQLSRERNSSVSSDNPSILNANKELSNSRMANENANKEYRSTYNSQNAKTVANNLFKESLNKNYSKGMDIEAKGKALANKKTSRNKNK